MPTSHQCSVSLLLASKTLAFRSELEAIATLYQQDSQRFHLVLAEPPTLSADFLPLPGSQAIFSKETHAVAVSTKPGPCLLWLELSPSRVTITRQGSSAFSYRHVWERGVYGFSRYWLQSESFGQSGQFCLRNYARNLIVEGTPFPRFVQVEYELWTDQMQLGEYILNLEMF